MARLPAFRSIYAVETDARSVDGDRVPVHHIGPAHDVAGKGWCGEQEQGGEEVFHAPVVADRASEGTWILTAKVIKFDPVVVGEGFRFDPDDILEGAKGQGFSTLAILAETEDGEIWISGSANAGETLILMERAKRQIVFGGE